MFVDIYNAMANQRCLGWNPTVDERAQRAANRKKHLQIKKTTSSIWQHTRCKCSLLAMSSTASEWENKWEADKVMIKNEEQIQSEMVKDEVLT